MFIAPPIYYDVQSFDRSKQYAVIGEATTRKEAEDLIKSKGFSDDQCFASRDDQQGFFRAICEVNRVTSYPNKEKPIEH